MDRYIAAEDIWHRDADTAAIARQLYPDRLVKSAQYPGSVEPWQAEWLSALPAKPKASTAIFKPRQFWKVHRLGDWPLFVLQVSLWGRMIPGPLGRSYQQIYGSAYGEPVSVATFDTIDSNPRPSLCRPSEKTITGSHLESFEAMSSIGLQSCGPTACIL
jgi:hypothetical protein